VSDLIQLYANANIRIGELERENAALREDSARLNWFINLDEEDRVKFCRGWYRWTIENVKAEIDAELKKEAV
jgi:hypothetical protein